MLLLWSQIQDRKLFKRWQRLALENTAQSEIKQTKWANTLVCQKELMSTLGTTRWGFSLQDLIPRLIWPLIYPKLIQYIPCHNLPKLRQLLQQTQQLSPSIGWTANRTKQIFLNSTTMRSSSWQNANLSGTPVLWRFLTILGRHKALKIFWLQSKLQRQVLSYCSI